MLRTTILLLFITVCIKQTIAQSDLSSDLLELEKKYFYSDNDSVKHQLILRKVDLYLTHNVINQDLLNEMKRIDYRLLLPKQLPAFFWNATLISYLNKNIYYSLHYLNKYETISKDSSIELSLLKLMIYSHYDLNKASISLHDLDSEFQCLNCLIESKNYQLNHKKLYKSISYFIPGSGMLLNGNLMKGTTSILLNTSTILAIKWLFINHQYINMISWGANLLSKFYIGNLHLTEKLLEKKEIKNKNRMENECEVELKRIIEKYPLSFKMMTELF